MILATARLSIKDPDLIDITIKSANTRIGLLLAPTWPMVAGIKKTQAHNTPTGKAIDLDSWFSTQPELSWDEYVEAYEDLIRSRYAKSVNQIAFIELLKAERAVLACYCTDAFTATERFLLASLRRLQAIMECP